MRTARRTLVAAAAAVVLMVLGLAAERTAHAEPRKDIQQKIKEAMENFDLLEYEEARKLLNQALTIAKKSKLDKDPIVAQVHVRLGIVYFAGLQDAESARLSFLSAVEIDPKVQIEPAYKTADMQKLLEEAKGVAASGGGPAAPAAPTGGGGGEAEAGDEVDCATLSGIQHTIVDTATAGAARPIEAWVGGDLPAAKVSLMYRAKGATDFSEVKMTKHGGCKYIAEIPASALPKAGIMVHYYVAAYNKAGKVLASRGSAGSPNIIEVSGGASSGRNGDDDENPFQRRGEASSGSSDADGTVSDGVEVPAKSPTVFVAIVAGTGGGYVTGTTEQAGNEVQCCFAPGLLHLLPEVGFYVSPKTSISVAGRIGFPLGANIKGHATAAPAGLLRLRHAFAADGSGVQISGSIGGGIIRNTVKLTEARSDMDTDIAAVGPLLVGAGAGYIAPLGGPLKLSAELNVLAAVPVVGTIGTSKLNFGVQTDFNVGLIFGF